MQSFKTLLKHSLHFYKKEWKRIILLLLPAEAIFCVGILVLKLGLMPARFAFVAFVASIVYIFMIISRLVCFSIVTGSGKTLAEIERNEYKGVEMAYKDILARLPKAVWILFLEVLYLLASAFLLSLLLVVLIVLPFILLVLLSKVFPSIVGVISTDNRIVFVFAGLGFALSAYLFAVSVVRMWFVLNAHYVEGRQGMDALAVGASIVTKKTWYILWRIVAITLLAFVPLFVIMAPFVNAIWQHIKLGLSIGLLLYMQHKIIPVIPEIPANLFIMTVVAFFTSSLFAKSIFTTLNYFLWKDIKSHIHSFKEEKYQRVRKYTKILVYIGAIIFVCLILSAIASK